MFASRPASARFRAGSVARDLLAGLGLVATVRIGEPFAEPLALAVSAGVQQLERIANS